VPRGAVTGVVSAGVAALGLLFAVACAESEPRVARAALRLPDTVVNAGGAASTVVPMLGCIDGPAATAHIVLGGSIAPPRRRRRRIQPQDTAWAPGAVADIAVTGAHVWVLDDVLGEVSVLNREFHVQRKLVVVDTSTRPAASFLIAVAGAPNGAAWVLFGNPPRIARYTPSGTLTAQIELSEPATDIASGPAGDVYVAYAPQRVTLEETLITTHDSVAVVERLMPTGERRAVVASLTRADLGTLRTTLPGPQRIRLVADRERLAVLYVAGGVVDVFHEDRRIATLQTCMPPAVSAAYERQLSEAGVAPRAQGWAPMVTDARFDVDGSISLATPLPDPDAGYQIVRYTATGQRREGLVASKGPFRLPWEWRFAGSDTTILAFELGGLIQSFALPRRAPQP